MFSTIPEFRTGCTHFVRFRELELFLPRDRLGDLFVQLNEIRLAAFHRVGRSSTLHRDAVSPGDVPSLRHLPRPALVLFSVYASDVPAGSKGEELQGRQRASERRGGSSEVEFGPADGVYEVLRVRDSPPLGRSVVNGGVDDDAKVRKLLEWLERRPKLALCKTRQCEASVPSAIARHIADDAPGSRPTGAVRTPPHPHGAMVLRHWSTGST